MHGKISDEAERAERGTYIKFHEISFDDLDIQFLVDICGPPMRGQSFLLPTMAILSKPTVSVTRA